MMLVILLCFVVGSISAGVCWIIKPFPISHRNAQGKKARSSYRVFSSKVSETAPTEGWDIVVIGSGVSGLTCASILARMGKSVLVLEKHPSAAGGSLHCFPLSNSPTSAEFDSGFHYTIQHSKKLLQLACGPAVSVPDFHLLNTERSAASQSATVFERVFLLDDEKQSLFDPSTPSLEMTLGETHLKHLRARARQTGSLAQLEQLLHVTSALNNRAMPALVVSRMLPKCWQPSFHRLFLRDFHHWARLTTEQALKLLLPGDPWLQAAMCSLWIDSAARPDVCAFPLMAAIQRGLPIEGGAYPSGGPTAVAKALVGAIEEQGSHVYIGADVTSIVTSEQGVALGVHVRKSKPVYHSDDNRGVFISARTVVSSIGYRATNRLLHFSSGSPVYTVADDERTNSQLALELPPASDSFIMCNVLVRGRAEELGITSCNTWIHPLKNGDLFDGVRAFYQQPEVGPFPAMITWPSLKNRKTCNDAILTCQILVPVSTAWFTERFGQLLDRESDFDYQTLKQQWRQRCTDVLMRFFPSVTLDRIIRADLSTPLSVREWLNTDEGSAVGLSPTPSRFSTDNITTFDSQCDTARLWTTGQDTLLMGVPMCQIAGTITAFRIAGFFDSCKFVVRSLLRLK